MLWVRVDPHHRLDLAVSPGESEAARPEEVTEGLPKGRLAHRLAQSLDLLALDQLQVAGIAQAGEVLDLAVLRRLEAACGLQSVPELEEVHRGHRLEHLDLMHEHAHDLRRSPHEGRCRADVPGTQISDDRSELVQEHAEPEFVHLVDDDGALDREGPGPPSGAVGIDRGSPMTQLFQEIEEAVASLSPLRHPFYRAWAAGKLSLEALTGYAARYHHHVLRFPTYVSALHSRCPSLPARQELLRNLMDEEGCEEHHAELWLRFTDALGLSRPGVEAAAPLPETLRLHRTLWALATEAPFAEGLAALHAYEAHVPEVVAAKIQALSEHYGMSEARALQFFTVHREADLWHSKATGEILEASATTDGARQRAKTGARRILQALWRFLDGVDRAYGQATGTPRHPATPLGAQRGRASAGRASYGGSGEKAGGPWT